MIIITGIAIIIRSLPAWLNAAWGCDFGIYYGLTKSFVETGELYNPYYGWGNSYQYFPVLYSVTGVAHLATGLDILTIMPKIAPIFGGLSVFIFYFLAYELFGSRKRAILSMVLLSVLPFHVYQLSHASPLTMGHFFMVLSLYLFVKFRKNIVYAFPLMISTVLLIMSHHLTTYFYMITLIFILFFENASRKNWTKHLKKDILYVLITSIVVFAYWIFIATPVFEDFMKYGFTIAGIELGPLFVIILFYFLFFISLPLSKIIWRFGIYSEKKYHENPNSNLNKVILKINVFINKKEPSIKSRKKIFFYIFLIFIVTMVIFSFIPLPWTNFPFTFQSIIFAIPLLLVFAFTAVGFRYTCHVKNGFFIRGWLFAIIISFLYATITHSTALLPHRHFEYLMYPVALIAIYGIGSLFSDPYFTVLFSKFREKINLYVNYKYKKIEISQKRRIYSLIFFIVLILILAGSVYPSHKSLNASDERITNEDLSIINWIDENLDKNLSLIASDHRLARIAEATGFNTTKDETIKLWDSEKISEFIDELMGIGKNHTRITHIIIDDIMKDDVVHVGFAKIVYMTNETSTAGYDKFLMPPFELVYRNETIDLNTGQPMHWAEIYNINWSYIENIYLS